MNGLYFDKKAMKLFVILLVATVVASVGIAALSHVYFGHDTEGKATTFTEGSKDKQTANRHMKKMFNFANY